MANDNVRRLGELLQSLDTVMLTTVDERGNLVSRPMALRVDRFEGSLRLFAPTRSRCIANIAGRATVNVSFASAVSSLSIAGAAHVITDPVVVAAHWHHRLDPWFPRGSAGVSMVEVTVDEARFWRVPDFGGASRSLAV